MAEGGTPRRLIELSRALLGWMPGGLAVVCLCTSAFFTTFTGGSGITIVAIGGLLDAGADRRSATRSASRSAWSPPRARWASCSRPRCR